MIKLVLFYKSKVLMYTKVIDVEGKRKKIFCYHVEHDALEKAIQILKEKYAHKDHTDKEIEEYIVYN